jgi:hypothetical protein
MAMVMAMNNYSYLCAGFVDGRGVGAGSDYCTADGIFVGSGTGADTGLGYGVGLGFGSGSGDLDGSGVGYA